ncbi:MAG: ribonucleoside triphosphate reductase, partial [Clostridia bacterium]|nr:ribonucleoside triphosphate reductase [Clostridia bacterium]
NEWAGAQAFSSFDTYLAPFVKADNLSYDAVKKCIESFIYGVNTPSRWGTQAPFSNITLDWTVPHDLEDEYAIVGGKRMDFKYGDCKKEMDMINRAFIETMIDGDAHGRGFQYPIPTYSITRDFDWSETENNKLLFEMTSKYGTPYFSNYVNSDMEPSDVRSMCCRLRLDLRELRKKSGGFFGSGESTGSIGVVTINMPRIAYLSENKEDFFKRLDHMMDISARSLKIKRTIITKLLDEGLYPYTKRYLGTFNNHFSTIGLVGMNEAGLNADWIKKDLTHKETQEFTKEVLNHMRERLSDYQEMYGDLYNLEATPAESTSYRLAKHDRQRYPDIICASEGETPYYTNSSHLPVGYTEDIFTALDVQDELQTLYTSGTVFHAYLGEKLPDWKAAATIVRKIADNYRLPYYSISPTYSVCREHGYIAGEHFTCPKCGKEAEVYSRITGYYRPVKNWNVGKSQEYKERKVYNIETSVLTHSGPKSEESCNDCANSAALSDGIYLFASATCPNCKIAEALLSKAGVAYTKILAEENVALTESLKIKQAPTLVNVVGGEAEKFVSVPNIKKFIQATVSVN